MTLSEFVAVLSSEGIEFESFRENVRDEMKINQLRQRFVQSAVVVSEQEIDHYLLNQSLRETESEPRYQLAHILLALDDATDASKEAKVQEAEALLEQVRQGEDFFALAKAHSDAASAERGGVNEFRPLAQLPPLFAEAIPNMQLGETAGPFVNESGVHLIQLVEVENAAKHIVKQVHARHILLRPSQILSDADAELRLQQVRERIQAGESFEHLAKTLSEDRVSAAQGGDLGWANPGQFVPEFEKELARLGPGELSPVFRSRFGWHLIELIERRLHDDTKAWKRNQAREEIAHRKGEEEYHSWLRSMRNEAYIEIRI
jgi:peptidyl-prolyl cis-trans isomerase SurA